MMSSMIEYLLDQAAECDTADSSLFSEAAEEIHRQNKEIWRLTALNHLFTDAFSEIKATHDGKSTQNIGLILDDMIEQCRNGDYMSRWKKETKK